MSVCIESVMSVDNIRELFSKRVQESLAFNKSDNSSNNDRLGGSDSSRQREFFTLQECDAGITEYLSDCKGFTGIIKQRFSDFHVHEIDSEGTVVHLTNFDIPDTKKESINEQVISDETWEELNNLSDRLIQEVKIEVTDFSKQKRKEIHQAIKWKYGSLVKSCTVSENNKKMLIVSLGKSTDRQDEWFSELGSYLHFVLFKTNMDTLEAINILSSYLRTRASNFTYAGTKDKRANTSQWVSMWHLDAKRLNGVNKTLQNFKVGNFVYKNEPLKLGDLKGNLFEVVLRDVTETDEIINTSLNTVKKNGFINYFGLQRFGNSVEIPTYEVGKALIKGDFETAVELILKPRAGKMRPDLYEARKVWWESRDAKRAFSCLKKRNNSIEGQLLKGLITHGRAYVNALDCMPRNVRLLYLHAYQSFIWNKIVSMRIKKFGQAVIEGDLVLSPSQDEPQLNVSHSKEEQFPTPKNSVKSLTNEEIGNYVITDVVYPLPGYTVRYPNNIIKKWYDELLKEDGLTPEHFKQTVTKYSLSGTYRHIIKKMKDMSWHLSYYSNAEDDLVLSDLDILNKRTLKDTNDPSKMHKAIVLKFTLEPSTYATMALREILKIDTSSSYQASLNFKPNKRTYDNFNEEQFKKSKM